MNIFLDAVSSESKIFELDEKNNIINLHSFNALLNESTLLIKEFDLFLQNIGKTYFDIENIIVVSGPGSFTGIRTIVIFVNTINFVIKKHITPINYFGLFDNYPIVKKSSQRDLFIKKDKNYQIEIISNNDFIKYLKENNIKIIYGDIDLELKDTKIISTPDYKKILKNIKLEKNTLIQPYYIKKPSIN